MDTNQADTINGNDPVRQMIILFTHTSVLMGAFIGMTLFQLLLFALSGHTADGMNYVVTGKFIPITFLMTALFGWWYIPNGYVNPQANRIQATDNMWSRSQFEDGGTQFIVYQAGFAWKYFWERKQGREVEVEAEKTLSCEGITITIDNISLEVILRGMWRAWLPRLSAFLQNIDDGSAVVLKQLQADINQAVESYASHFENTEHVRKCQRDIVDYAFECVVHKYREYGLNLLDLKFEKCDYSKETQKELDQMIKWQQIQKISGKDPELATVIAAAMAGKVEASHHAHTYEFKMGEHVSQSIEGLAPALNAGLTAFVANQKKKRGNQ